MTLIDEVYSDIRKESKPIDSNNQEWEPSKLKIDPKLFQSFE